MAPALAPALIGQEAAACALLGLVLGSVRAVFPVRGRAAFLPDMALVGAVLLGLQSYAAALSAGGVLRWYMPGSAFLRFWGRTASAACPAGTGTGAVLAGGGAAPAGPAGIAAAGSSPQKPGGAGQSAPRAKKKRKKTEKELAKHTAVVV